MVTKSISEASVATICIDLSSIKSSSLDISQEDFLQHESSTRFENQEEAEKQTVEYKSYAGMIFQSFKNVAHTSLT